MNYVPVVAGNQTNSIVRSKENLVAGQDDKKKELKQEYILIPIYTIDSLLSQGSKDSIVDAGKKAPEVDESEASDNGEKNDQVSRSEVEGLPQQARQTENINSPNSFNTVSSPVNTVGSSFVNAASQTPINVAGPSACTNAFEEHYFERFSPFKNAFSLPHVPIVTPISLEKKDERGIVIKNKARLVAQGHTQEEGIDYDEVFAPIAKIEAIRLFLAYASFKDFVVYQMDVKSAFLYGRIEEEAIKRIFRYLKGQPKLGLWYPKDLPFDLEAYSDSDYVRASLDRKSKIREYVAAANCCRHVLWIQN
nr:retrovirus-related Pol polyprotein from transposon TNT 1-94 [Tanacetum cinerariifolium]